MKSEFEAWLKFLSASAACLTQLEFILKKAGFSERARAEITQHICRYLMLTKAPGIPLEAERIELDRLLDYLKRRRAACKSNLAEIINDYDAAIKIVTAILSGDISPLLEMTITHAIHDDQQLPTRFPSRYPNKFSDHGIGRAEFKSRPTNEF